MRHPLIRPGNDAFLGCLGHPSEFSSDTADELTRTVGKRTTLSPDLFSERAAVAGNMVTERHNKSAQMRRSVEYTLSILLS